MNPLGTICFLAVVGVTYIMVHCLVRYLILNPIEFCQWIVLGRNKLVLFKVIFKNIGFNTPSEYVNDSLTCHPSYN